MTWVSRDHERRGDRPHWDVRKYEFFRNDEDELIQKRKIA